jgi:hypothetical protein
MENSPGKLVNKIYLQCHINFIHSPEKAHKLFLISFLHSTISTCEIQAFYNNFPAIPKTESLKEDHKI